MPRRLCLLISFTALLFLCPTATAAESGSLVPFFKDGKWGFRTPEGKVAIQPRFDGFGRFSDGLAPVRIGENWGYIDTKGKMVIQPAYFDARPFSDSVAWVMSRGAGFGGFFIDKTGKTVIPAEKIKKYVFVHPFSEGLAGVGKKPGRFGFIDKQGKLVVRTKWEDVAPFKDGLAHVRDDAYHSSAFINREGKAVIRADDTRVVWRRNLFYTLDEFSEGLARACSRKNHLCGYIDTSGKYVIQPVLEAARSFSEGMAPAAVSSVWRVWNKEGKFVEITPEEGRAQGYQTHRDASKRAWEQLKWGFVGRDGKFVIEAKFDEVGKFSEGLAAVAVDCDNDKIKCRYGFIDKKGDYVIKPKFFKARHFANGLAPVEVPGCYGDPNKACWTYIRRDGTFFLNQRYHKAAPFEHGIGAVRKNYDMGLVDLDGNVVFPPEGQSWIRILAGADDTNYYDLSYSKYD
jgi:hypothetical protein